MAYPTSIKSFTSRVAGDTIQPAHVNDLQAETTALETQLLTTGTWVPAIASAGGGAATYSVQAGFYVRNGNRIDFWGRITMATTGTLAAGAVTITGLPVAALTTGNYFGSCNFNFWNGLNTAVVALTGTVAAGATVVTLRHAAAAAIGLSTTVVADIANNTDVVFAGSYLVA